MKLQVIALVCATALVIGFACAKENDTEVKLAHPSFYGHWERVGFDKNKTRFIKSTTLTPNGYGFSLLEDGTFIERKEAGWCGTPPIIYANYNGTWKAINDSTLDISVGYWGGTTQYNLKIKEIKKDSLTVEFIYPIDKN